MGDREPERWISTKSGKHIPIYAGDSKEDIQKRINDSYSKSDSKSTSKSSDSEKKAVSKSQKKKDALAKDSQQKKEHKDLVKKYEKENAEKAERKQKTQDKKESEMAKASENIKSLNDEEQYRDSIKQGNAVTFKRGKAMFKGKEVAELDTADALAEIKGDDKHPGKENSLSKHLDANGNLSEERKKMHAQIMQDYFNGVIEKQKDKDAIAHHPYAPGEEHVAMFTGGGGASGKGTFSKDIDKFYSQNKNPMVIDPDKIKEVLLQRDNPNKPDIKLDKDTTGYYHEESSALAKQIYETALEHNFPLMYDGTATGGGVYKLLAKAKEKGYKSEMNFLFSDWKTVRKNALGRLEKTGRFVPPAALVGAHMKAYKAVEGLQDKFDSFKLWDNASYKMALVGESTSGKNLKISNAESWNRFKTSYDDFHLSQEEIDNFYHDADAIEEKRRRAGLV